MKIYVSYAYYSVTTCAIFFHSPIMDQRVSIASNVWAKVQWIESIDGQIPLKSLDFTNLWVVWLYRKLSRKGYYRL